MGKVVSKPDLDMSKLTQNENREISKLMTHQLVREVTKTMNAVNFVGFEQRIYQLIIGLLENPIRKMQQSEDILKKMSESLRRNIRRTHELEYIVQKYSKAVSLAEKFENRYDNMESKLNT